MDPKLAEHFARCLDLDIRCGYHAPEEVAARMHERLQDEAPDLTAAQTAEWVAKLEAGLAAQLSREETWSELTANDRISLAFAELMGLGVVALEDAGYTQSDGWEDVADERDSVPNAWGAVFFHRQDVERGVGEQAGAEGQGLYLTFDAFSDLPERASEALRLGRLICDTLSKHGVPTLWNATTKQRILILPFEWRRRR